MRPTATTCYCLQQGASAKAYTYRSATGGLYAVVACSSSRRMSTDASELLLMKQVGWLGG